ncbi:MAG TPA: DUF4232 domain-containing protein [Trebonia sp.]|jgi:hypothetical protein
MRFRTSAAVALSVVAAGLGVAGCSPTSTGASSIPAPSGSPIQAGTGSAPAGGTSATQAAADSGSSGSENSGSGGSGSGTAASGSGGRCQPTDLRVALGTNTPGSGNSYLKVDLTNVSSASCTMDGYPGVNLVGTAHGQNGYQWPLERSTVAQPSLVTLAPGAVAHFTMSYLAWGDGTAGEEIKVDEIIITPPDDTTQTNVTWKQGVLLQDAATHPGTWIEPVQAGA